MLLSITNTDDDNYQEVPNLRKCIDKNVTGKDILQLNKTGEKLTTTDAAYSAAIHLIQIQKDSWTPLYLGRVQFLFLELLAICTSIVHGIITPFFSFN